MATEPPLSADAVALETRAKALAAKATALVDDLATIYLGSTEEIVKPLVQASLAGCHVLLEGMPGLGKTLLAKALANGLGGLLRNNVASMRNYYGPTAAFGFLSAVRNIELDHPNIPGISGITMRVGVLGIDSQLQTWGAAQPERVTFQ